MNDLQKQARALGDPTRYGIFRFVAESSVDVGVADLASRFGLHHNAIRQHLARMLDADVLQARTSSPAGPGRPRLIYRVNPTVGSRWEKSGPYERLSILLCEVIADREDPRGAGRAAGRRDAVHGATIDDLMSSITERMAQEGFEPEVEHRTEGLDIVLHNCPFQMAAASVPEVVCTLHRGLIEGATDGEPRVTVTDLVVEDPTTAGCRFELDVSTDESTPS